MIRLGIQKGIRPILLLSCKSQSLPVTAEAFQIKAHQVLKESFRWTSFFNKLSSDEIWKGITTVSNPGKRRGRGKRQLNKGKMDLNRGQQIGVGKANIKFPGLNSPIIQGHEVVEMEKLPEDPEYNKKKIELRTQMIKRNKTVVHPLERGWTSNTICGRDLGPPDPIGEEKFENFHSVVLDVKHTTKMTGLLGRVRKTSVLAVTGNKNGLLGVGYAAAQESKAAVKRAIKKASLRLLYYELLDSYTVNHDFFYQLGHTKIIAHKQPRGYGLVCHRAIAECCKLIGIEDIHVKVEGAMNIKHVVKGFLLGLLDQRTYKQLAEERKLHLVEYRKERNNFPVLLASPTEILTAEEERKNPVSDFSQYILGDRLIYKRNKYNPEQTTGYSKYLKRTSYMRNHEKVKINILAEYGEYRSHLTDVYPECRPQKFEKKKVEVSQ